MNRRHLARLPRSSFDPRSVPPRLHHLFIGFCPVKIDAEKKEARQHLNRPNRLAEPNRYEDTSERTRMFPVPAGFALKDNRTREFLVANRFADIEHLGTHSAPTPSQLIQFCAYQAFLDIWPVVDPGIPIIKEAKTQYPNLH
jgi:hypothetical protein